MIVLDTNVVSELGKPKSQAAVSRWLERQQQADLYLCAPVVMELSFGAESFLRRTGSDRYLRALDLHVGDRFFGKILAFDEGMALLTGKARASRERAGRPISIPDAMIAAICLAHGAMLATRNTRDFEGLDLKLVNPFEAGA